MVRLVFSIYWLFIACVQCRAAVVAAQVNSQTPPQIASLVDKISLVYRYYRYSGFLGALYGASITERGTCTVCAGVLVECVGKNRDSLS